jgi:hypothetical protein
MRKLLIITAFAVALIIIDCPQVTSPIAPTPTCLPEPGHPCPAPHDQSGY